MKRIEQHNPHFLPPKSGNYPNPQNRLNAIQEWLRCNFGIVTKVNEGEKLFWIVDVDEEQPIYSLNKENGQEKTYVHFEGIDPELQLYHKLRKIKQSFCNPAVYDCQGVDVACNTVDRVVQYGRLLAVQDLPSKRWRFICGGGHWRDAYDKEQQHLDNLPLITDALP